MSGQATPKPLFTSLKQRLQEARTAAGLTKVQAANALSLSSQQMWNMENRDEDISATKLFLIADLYQVSARWLATGETTPEPLGFDQRAARIARAISVLPQERQEALAVILGISFETKKPFAQQ